MSSSKYILVQCVDFRNSVSWPCPGPRKGWWRAHNCSLSICHVKCWKCPFSVSTWKNRRRISENRGHQSIRCSLLHAVLCWYSPYWFARLLPSGSSAGSCAVSLLGILSAWCISQQKKKKTHVAENISNTVYCSSGAIQSGGPWIYALGLIKLNIKTEEVYLKKSS